MVTEGGIRDGRGNGGILDPKSKLRYLLYRLVVNLLYTTNPQQIRIMEIGSDLDYSVEGHCTQTN